MKCRSSTEDWLSRVHDTLTPACRYDEVKAAESPRHLETSETYLMISRASASSTHRRPLWRVGKLYTCPNPATQPGPASPGVQGSKGSQPVQSHLSANAQESPMSQHVCFPFPPDPLSCQMMPGERGSGLAETKNRVKLWTVFLPNRITKRNFYIDEHRAAALYTLTLTHAPACAARRTFARVDVYVIGRVAVYMMMAGAGYES